MKNRSLPVSLLFLCSFFFACSKSDGTAPLSSSTYSTFSFSANDSLIKFPVNLAYTQEVYNTHTTLISGQYKDTPVTKGSLSIRLIGDTTGTYRGDSLLVTYVNAAGNTFYNDAGDSTSFVRVDKFEKKYNGNVNGSFTLRVTNPSGSINLSNGAFTVLYQE